MENVKEVFETLKKAANLIWVTGIWISLKSMKVLELCLKQIPSLQEDLTEVKNLRQERAE